MPETLDFLFGEYRSAAVKLLDGTVLEQTEYPINTKVMDAPFVFGQNIVQGLKEYFEAKNYDVKHIIVFNTLITNLKRGPDISMRSKNVLYVIKNERGELNAIYFSGCALGEPIIGDNLPE